MANEQLNTSQFLSEKFNAAEYINNFLENVKPGEEAKRLHTLRNALNTRNNAASETIKDIVFEHYKHFIETSKEISNLEREIYQLSTLLLEQKNIIEKLMEMNGQERKSSDNSSIGHTAIISQNQLPNLMHKLDGFAAIFNDRKELEENWQIILENQMELLNSDTMEPMHNILLILFGNTLLIGHPSSPGSKYPFQMVANYSLDNIAIVNFKNHDTNLNTEKHILQLLIFPEQLYVKCESARIKKAWLEGIEQAKKKREQAKSHVRQATIRARRRSNLSTIASKRQNKTSSKTSEEEKNLFEHKKLTLEDTQWLNDLIEELQDVIHHQHMEQAVEMLLEWKDCGCKDNTINAKFLSLERTVVQMLSDEVHRPGALHGGARALSRPLALLTSLGRSVYAIDLYLKRRGAFLRQTARELTISEEPLSYVRQVSTLFINEIVDVAKEFNNQKQHYCLILQWSSVELSVLLSMIRRHVIEVASTMTVLSHTWRILMSNCEELIPIGIDLSFEVHRLLAPALTMAMETNFENIIDSVRIRISEEKWRAYNLENESNLNRFLEEMSDFGLSIDWAVNSSSRIHLNIPQSACQFARVAYSLCRDFATLNSAYLKTLSDSFVQMLWCEYLLHLDSAPKDSEIHRVTSQFIIGQVIPLCDEIYKDSSKGLICQLLPEKFPSLLKFSKNSSSFDEEIANV